MVGLRTTVMAMRTAFFVAVWSVAAFVLMVLSVVKGNVGFFAIAIAVLLVGGVTTRAPGELRAEGFTEPAGRFLLGVALCLGTVGAAIVVWLR